MTRFRSPLNLILLGVGIAVTLAGFALIPATLSLPVHWGVTGQVDATLPRDWALLQLPVVVAVVWAIFWAVDRFGSEAQREASSPMMNVALTAVTGLIVLIQLLVVLIGLGVVVNVLQAVVIAIALMQLALGNVMPKSRPNAVAGIRIPSTLADPANWQATHRLAGRLIMASGALLILAAFLLPPGIPLIVAIVASWIVPMVVASIYSLLHALRASQPQS